MSRPALIRTTSKKSRSSFHQYSVEERKGVALHINSSLKSCTPLIRLLLIPIDVDSPTDLFVKTANGLVLAYFVNTIKPGLLNAQDLVPPANNFSKLELCHKTLRAARGLGVVLTNFANEDLVDHQDREKDYLRLGLLAQLVTIDFGRQLAQYFTGSSVFSKEANRQAFLRLLEWCNQQIADSFGKEVVAGGTAKDASARPPHLTNFTSDVTDSQAYVWLLHSLFPQCTLTPLAEPDLLKRAAEQSLFQITSPKVLSGAALVGVSQFLSPSDIVGGKADANFSFCANLFAFVHRPPTPPPPREPSPPLLEPTQPIPAPNPRPAFQVSRLVPSPAPSPPPPSPPCSPPPTPPIIEEKLLEIALSNELMKRRQREDEVEQEQKENKEKEEKEESLEAEKRRLEVEQEREEQKERERQREAEEVREKEKDDSSTEGEDSDATPNLGEGEEGTKAGQEEQEQEEQGQEGEEEEVNYTSDEMELLSWCQGRLGTLHGRVEGQVQIPRRFADFATGHLLLCLLASLALLPYEQVPALPPLPLPAHTTPDQRRANLLLALATLEQAGNSSWFYFIRSNAYSTKSGGFILRADYGGSLLFTPKPQGQVQDLQRTFPAPPRPPAPPAPCPNCPQPFQPLCRPATARRPQTPTWRPSWARSDNGTSVNSQSLDFEFTLLFRPARTLLSNGESEAPAAPDSKPSSELPTQPTDPTPEYQPGTRPVKSTTRQGMALLDTLSWKHGTVWHEGFLDKRGDTILPVWQRRYFEIKDEFLCYYAPPKGKEKAMKERQQQASQNPNDNSNNPITPPPASPPLAHSQKGKGQLRGYIPLHRLKSFSRRPDSSVLELKHPSAYYKRKWLLRARTPEEADEWLAYIAEVRRLGELALVEGEASSADLYLLQLPVTLGRAARWLLLKDGLLFLYDDLEKKPVEKLLLFESVLEAVGPEQLLLRTTVGKAGEYRIIFRSEHELFSFVTHYLQHKVVIHRALSHERHPEPEPELSGIFVTCAICREELPAEKADKHTCRS